MLKESLYYAKILLFGEYGIIEDSMGLSIPYTFFKGKFDFSSQFDENQKSSNNNIAKFVFHLKEMDAHGNLPCKFDFNKIESDLKNGLYFDSSIPQGFGVGSSGALVAALYNHYATDQVEADMVMKGDNLANLKVILSTLESYFHGKSSGLDPLICYLNLPILIKGKGDLGAVGIPTENMEGKGAIFLMDSGSPGKTKGMVAIFLQKLKDEGFRNLVRTQLKKYNDGAVKSFLKGENKPLFENVKAISSLFLHNFKPMIPHEFEGIWRKGLETNAYYLKLCGSGGGGFVLGFTEDFEQAEKMLSGHKLQVIYKI